MSSPQYRHRERVLQSVIRETDIRLDGILPLYVPGLREAFENDVELLAALQMRWYTRLNGRIDVEQERLSDLGAAVALAWRLTAADLPGLRMVVDHLAATPPSPEMGRMLAKARRNEHIMMALMAGLATLPDDRAAELGADLEHLARQEPNIPSQDARMAGRSLIARLRAKLAA